MQFATKLFLFSLLTGFISILSFEYIALQKFHETLLDRETTTFQSIAMAKELHIRQVLENLTVHSKSISSRTLLRQELHRKLIGSEEEYGTQKVEEILADAIEPFPDILLARIYTTDGTELVRSGTSLTEIDESLFDNITVTQDTIVYTKPEEAQAHESISPTIEENIIRYRNTANVPHVNHIAPIRYNGTIIALLSLDFSIDPLTAITSDGVGLEKSGESMLAFRNDDGDTQFFTPQKFDGLTIIPQERSEVTIQRAMRNEAGLSTEYVDYRNVPVFSVTKYIDEVDWALVVKRDLSEVLEPTIEIRTVVFSIGLVIYILFSISLYILFARLTAPLEFLVNASEKIQRGQFNEPLPQKYLESRDEIGMLARSLSSLASRVKGTYQWLESQVKETRSAKSRLESILSNMGEGLLLVDTNMRIVVANNAAINLLDRTRAELEGKRLEDSMPVVSTHQQKGDAFIFPSIKELLSSQEAVTYDSFEIVRGDSTRFPAVMTISRVLHNNTPSGIIIVFRDITAQQSLDTTKDEFVWLASHQLRTPLTAISWYTEILLQERKGKLNDAQHKYLQRVYQGATRMGLMINSFLQISRIELGTFMIKPRKLSLENSVESILKDLRSTSEEKKLAIKTTFDSSAQTYFADPVLLTVIFQNIISNAIKYTPPGGSINIELTRDNNSSEIIFTVRDTGYGIPKRQQSKIFTKLFRADNIKEQDTDGTGLGLYLVKSVLDFIGGDISFSSKVNVGSSFIVRLPKDGMRKKEGTTTLTEE